MYVHVYMCIHVHIYKSTGELQEFTFKPQVEQKKQFAHVKARYPASGGSRLMENITDELLYREDLEHI